MTQIILAITVGLLIAMAVVFGLHVSFKSILFINDYL